MTFENFEVRPGTESAYAAAQAFTRTASGFTILVLAGSKGSGKSHLLEAVGRTYLADGATVRYEFVPELFDRLRGSFSAGTESLNAMMDQLRDVGLLILDDLGLRQQATDWEIEKVTSLVDHRYRTGGRLAVATNNLTQAEMATKTGDRLADRLWDSNTGRVQRVFLECGSYRTETVVSATG